MPITPGWNILRFTRAYEDKNKKIHGTVFDAYKFEAVNMATEQIEFVYIVPVGRKVSQLIRDLQYLIHTKEWMDVELKEEKRILKIISMKRVGTAQQQLDAMVKAQRVRYN